MPTPSKFCGGVIGKSIPIPMSIHGNKNSLGHEINKLTRGTIRPHTPLMKVRTKEEALKETPYLEVDDLAWLKSLRTWLTDEEWHSLMVLNPRRLYDW